MGEMRIVSPGKTRGFPYPGCKKLVVFTAAGVGPGGGRKYIPVHHQSADYWDD